jgi:D-alanyl-D-alanine carboxypeptidase (penicillin-binding protein 5/6)
LNAAETIGSRGVRLALRGDYHAAASEFSRALRADSTFDLTRCSGFWGMQPAGYVAAARAYALSDRTTDAKSLLTVIKLSCGTHRELESLLNQVVAPVKS